MASTVYVDLIGPPVNAAWLNDVNNAVYGGGGNISSNLIDYLPGGTGAVDTTVQTKLRQVVSILDFGADPTGVIPCDTALANARAYIASNHAQLVFPAGTYTYSVSPNWGISYSDITTNGLVTLNYTGTGYAVLIDAGATPAVGYVYGMSFAGNFKVKSNALALDAVFVRSVHHSKISVRITGCGPTYAGLRVNFAVCTEFNIVVSGNEPPLFPIPLYGMYLDCRGPTESTAACIFNNPIIEGVTGTGIYLATATQNTFTGGTSEGNLGLGLYVSSNCSYNTFNKLDLEVNGVATGDILDLGVVTTFNGCLSGGLPSTKVTFSGANAIVSGGTYNYIYNTGSGTNFNNVVFSNNGGVFSNTGTKTSSTRLYNNTTGTYDADIKPTSIGPTITSAADSTATTILTLPTVGSNFYQVLVYLPLAGDTANYSAYAVVSQDLTSTRIMSQVNGTRMVLSLVGQALKATQTSGITQNITAIANAI